MPKTSIYYPPIGISGAALVGKDTLCNLFIEYFKKLYKNELLDQKKTNELEGYMTNTIFENWLRPGIPSDVILVPTIAIL